MNRSTPTSSSGDCAAAQDRPWLLHVEYGGESADYAYLRAGPRDAAAQRFREMGWTITTSGPESAAHTSGDEPMIGGHDVPLSQTQATDAGGSVRGDQGAHEGARLAGGRSDGRADRGGLPEVLGGGSGGEHHDGSGAGLDHSRDGGSRAHVSPAVASAATRSDWSDVNMVTRRVWIVYEGRWANVVPLHPRRYARLIDALAEIESFPVSGYHAGAAQRIAREILSDETVTKPADLPCGARADIDHLCAKPGCGKPATDHDAWGQWCDDHNGGWGSGPADGPPRFMQLPDSWPEAAKHEVWRLDAIVDRYRKALIRIAAEKRSDGTYNLSREVCELIAREALDG